MRHGDARREDISPSEHGLGRSTGDASGARERDFGHRLRLLEAMPVPLWITRVRDHTILVANQRALDMFGLSRDAVFAGSFDAKSMWVHPERRTRFLECLRVERRVESTEEEIVTPRGEIKSVILSAEVVDIEGEQCLVTVLHDISARRAAERTLLETQERFDQLGQNIDTVFLLRRVDPFEFLYVSPSCQRIFGIPAEQIYGDSRAVFSIIHPEDREKVMSAVRMESIERGEIERREVEFRIVRPDGSIRTCLARDRAAGVEDGVVTRVAVVVDDITERRRMESALVAAREEADAANKAKSALLSRVSHELRTPLNAILGFGQLLAMDDLTADQSESTARILSAGDHLLALIDDVLDTSQLEIGRMTLAVCSVDVGDVVRQAVAMIAPLAARRQVTFDVVPEIPSGLRVMADRRRLVQVLLNLLANAVNYNREGGRVWVTVDAGNAGGTRAAAGAGAGGTGDGAGATGAGAGGAGDGAAGSGGGGEVVRLTVRDTGIGIAADDLPRLFEPFERIATERTQVTGTGLGLALSKRLLDAMGGRIEVSSRPDEGTSFVVELPAGSLSSFDDDEPRPGADRSPDSTSDGAVTVLYVEDDESNIELLGRILAVHADVALKVATRGRDAVQAAASSSPDVILLDLHLPDMPGEEVLQSLRRDPRTAVIPVVVLTADATPARSELLLELGADAYVVKPYDAERLLALLTGIAESRGRRIDRIPIPRAEPVGLLDRQVVTTLHGLERAGEPGVSLLVATFLASAEDRLEQLGQAMVDGDAQRVEALAHSLAGSGANFGARAFAECARTLSKSAAPQRRASWPEDLAALGLLFTETKAVLRDEFRSPAAAPL